MIEYVFKMLFCLLAAAALGFLVSWFLTRLRTLELEDQVFSLKRSLTDRDVKVSAAERRANESESNLKFQQESTLKADTEFQSVKDQRQNAVDHSTRLTADVSTKEASLASLTAIIAMREQALKERDYAAKTAESRISGFEKTIAEQTNLLRSRDESLTAKEARLIEIENLASRRSSEIDTLRGQLASAHTELEVTAKTHDSEISRLKTSLIQGDAKISDSSFTSNPLSPVHPKQYASAPIGTDPIKHIYGVGPALEKTLNGLGVYYFKQVALWTEAEIDFFDSKLPNFHGRIRREQWQRSAVEEHYKKYGEWLGKGDPLITMPETNRT